jgi:hypothetical protein
MFVTCFPLQRPEFDNRSGHVGFVVDKMALGQAFSEYLSFFYQFQLYQPAHMLQSSCHRLYIFWIVTTFFNNKTEIKKINLASFRTFVIVSITNNRVKFVLTVLFQL